MAFGPTFKSLIHFEFLYMVLENVTARKIKKTIPFTIPSKRTNYLAINLTKDMKDLYSENYKALIKKLKTQ